MLRGSEIALRIYRAWSRPERSDHSRTGQRVGESNNMRKLLSLIALFCVMAIGAGVSVSSANAATLTSAVQSLKAQQTGVAEKAYYRRGYHRGYYHRRYYGGYYHRGYGYGGYGYHRRCWWRYGRRICRW